MSSINLNLSSSKGTKKDCKLFSKKIVSCKTSANTSSNKMFKNIQVAEKTLRGSDIFEKKNGDVKSKKKLFSVNVKIYKPESRTSNEKILREKSPPIKRVFSPIVSSRG